MPRVPNRTIYDPVINAVMHTGENATAAVVELLHAVPTHSMTIAMDIETPGLDDAFSINCVTAAWEWAGRTHSVLLDPMRNSDDLPAMQTIVELARTLLFHNAPFDVPALYHHGLIGIRDVDKIVDTVVLARFAFPDSVVRKGLGALAERHLGMADNADGMKLAFKAAGFKTIQAGYEGMDIGSAIYRQGAMLDTVATLRLEPILRQKCIEWTLEHPFESYGATTVAEAEEVLEVCEVDHRVMLRRTARGLAVDTDYLNRYGEQVDTEQRQAEAILAERGLDGGVGKGAALVQYLADNGELPEPWPRTPKGALRATKDDLEALDHPLAKAQRTIAEVEKVMGWLNKVEHQARTTGRCHPQVGTLAASATGRMSYSEPPMQQFSAAARGIIVDDGQGLTSIDWSQIEPVTMGCMAGDEEFLAPYERGDDLYEPLMRAAGISRPMAKVGLLADMYGQGEAGMAKRLGLTLEQAGQIRRQIRAAMPQCTRWMAKVQDIAAEYGVIVTGGGRILPVDRGGVFKAVNYIVQGTAADVLMHTIAEMERRGIGDHFQLAMHDELVVDTEVADEVQQIMTTPPAFFEDWLGRAPVLRSDRADMGHQWQKV